MTLAQVLLAGNRAAGTQIILNDGSGSGGGGINFDGSSATNCTGMSAAGGQDLNFSGQDYNLQGNGGQVLLNGQEVTLNNGSGNGGGTVNLDGGVLNFGNVDGSTPSNQVTPIGWTKVQEQGTIYWLAKYQ